MYPRISLPPIFLAAVLGVAGGFYIYKPILEQYHKNQNKLKENLQAPEELQEKKG
ncbi:protein PIGBOS1 [Emydura macquarii macquarii]|uniref:protein PIGBOS1 n=1 Tax=Emydura macquarii macquarii TaxID=1129001 RepID=UPI00352AD643